MTSGFRSTSAKMRELISIIKMYVLVRFKKRWPVIPITAIFSLFCYLNFESDHSRALRCFKMSPFFVIVAILAPYKSDLKSSTDG